MKLIDLLVQELPKRGGWPDGAEIAVQDADSQICFSSHGDVYANKCQTDWYGGDWGDGDWSNPFINTIADDRHKCIVSRDQYEVALAASQKPAWNGEGVPPIGTRCRIIISDRDFGECEILFVGESLLVWRQDSTYHEGSGYHRHMKFRPIRTEADKKREAALDAIYGAIASAEREHNRSDEADKVYEAIAAGKIPGVKLED